MTAFEVGLLSCCFQVCFLIFLVYTVGHPVKVLTIFQRLPLVFNLVTNDNKGFNQTRHQKAELKTNKISQMALLEKPEHVEPPEVALQLARHKQVNTAEEVPSIKTCARTPRQ